MIDIEPVLFTELATALRADVPGIFVTGETVSAPPQLPCTSIVEMSNTTYARTLDSAHKEYHSALMWQMDFFSNLTTGRKAQCKAMAKIVDNIMISRNFKRTFLEPTDNADTKIYRMTARYTALVGSDYRLYQN